MTLFQDWLKALPYSYQDATARVSLREPAEIPKAIEECVKEAESYMATNEFLDIDTCRKCAVLAHELVEILPSLKGDDERIAHTAIWYFLESDDGENDFESPIGFDDDLEVLESALKTLKEKKTK